MGWENSALLCCPQEPPEDDANIIEKILASRMVQKEVSGKDVSGDGGPWAEDRQDLAALCSRDIRCRSSRCCRAIPCSCRVLLGYSQTGTFLGWGSMWCLPCPGCQKTSGEESVLGWCPGGV